MAHDDVDGKPTLMLSGNKFHNAAWYRQGLWDLILNFFPATQEI